MSGRTYEDYINAVVSVDETAKQAQWLKGDLLKEARDEGLKQLREKANKKQHIQTFIKQMASDLGCTARYVQELIRVAETFPEEERALDQSWYLHRVAARTEDPKGWLERAVAAGWSTRQLEEALWNACSKGNEEEKAKRKADRIRRTLEEFLEEQGQYAKEEIRRIYTILENWLLKGGCTDEQN